MTNPAFPPSGQARYQVRFDVGSGGLARIGDADVIVWVDALGASPIDLDTVPSAGVVLAADLRSRAATARWILDHQVASGRRISISIVSSSGDGVFGSADVLVAGAVVDSLATLGIDFTSPEAAVACAAFSGLTGAVGHLLTASVLGQQLVADGSMTVEAVRERAVLDADVDPVVLRAPAA
ncbi:hypothetical protein ELQ94_03445 [Labedella endophytica]|uniref:2-phosphosulfolactate phosphatase n=1 Tax=Labedella endophytica TaxID=1523160 RepID=A0A433JX60_9MICO|nr:hypothetical protein [Labedella endophytica]RUR03595.1 hypothetical protein ELQ94_03445 [Labedella endophytica]